MHIDKTKKFVSFLEALVTEENASLIESIAIGYGMINESDMSAVIRKMQAKVAQDQKPAPAGKPVTESELKGLEQYLDKLFDKLGIDVAFTQHFLQRVNDVRNKKQITINELQEEFEKTYKQYGVDLSHEEDLEAVIMDMDTHLNIPFVLFYDPQANALKLKAKTIMRKDGFLTSSPKLYV